jgi:hypothetical protein
MALLFNIEVVDMSDFVNNIFSVFSHLIDKHGFIPAKAVSGDHFVSLVKKYTDNVFIYLFVRDERAGSGEMSVQLWIAPPDLPDDTLENLGIGYKILIASTYEPDDRFFDRVEKRVLNLLPLLDDLAKGVEIELQKPPFQTKRLVAYRCEKQAFINFMNCASKENDTEVRDILEQAKKLAAGKGTLDSLGKKVTRFTPKLLANNCLLDDTANFFGGDPRFIGTSLANRLYVEELGKLARL